MDAALLTKGAFWNDPTPFAAGGIPDLPALSGHVLFETSGSTGKPKWVAISKTALLTSAAAVNRHLEIDTGSHWGLALPLNHVGGFGVAARAYQAGCRLSAFTRRWNAPEFTDWLARHSITHTTLVPAQVHDLVSAGCVAPPDIKAIVVGGGQLDTSSGQAARHLGWPVLASYGMTECSSQIATQDLELLNSPYQPAPIRILPIWKTSVDEMGRLEISGPALFSGYLINGEYFPRQTETHVTSDKVTLDGKFLTPLGRTDSIVKILGELVDPEAIEKELVDLSEGDLILGNFAIVAIPDSRRGHFLQPVFESKSAADNATPALTEYNRTAPGFRRLRDSVILPSIPRSGLGKLLRRDLTKFAESWLNGPD